MLVHPNYSQIKMIFAKKWIVGCAFKIVVLQLKYLRIRVSRKGDQHHGYQ
jgi:hypothetical protein